ncbi:MAG: HD domain-containing protein [Firmicutes bacterium]|nr:HD domain-containing protein [Bacillota bacterium]
MAVHGAMTVREILAMPINTHVYGQFVVRDCELRGSEGRYFLRLLLGDKTGVIPAYVWNFDINQRSPKVGDVAKIQGTRGEFQSSPKIDVQWGSLRRGDIPVDELIDLPSVPDFARKYIEQIDRLFAAELTDPHLKRWSQYFLGNDGFREKFCLWPAAKSNHHAYPGGLIRHTYHVMQMCRQAAREMYPELLTPIGYQTLLFAAVFHDVGKLEELAMHPITGDVYYTDRGQRFGHILLGRDRLREAAAKLDIPQGLVERVDELILGHQGKKEWDTVREPVTLEGVILAAADYFDSQIGNMEMAYRGYTAGVGEDFQFVRPFGRYMYVADASERKQNNLERELRLGTADNGSRSSSA